MHITWTRPKTPPECILYSFFLMEPSHPTPSSRNQWCSHMASWCSCSSQIKERGHLRRLRKYQGRHLHKTHFFAYLTNCCGVSYHEKHNSRIPPVLWSFYMSPRWTRSSCEALVDYLMGGCVGLPRFSHSRRRIEVSTEIPWIITPSCFGSDENKGIIIQGIQLVATDPVPGTSILFVFI